MVSTVSPNTVTKTRTSRGRDDSRQRGGASTRDTEPRRMSKALRQAIARRDMMIRTGAPAENIAVIDARIERLGGVVTPITDAPSAAAVVVSDEPTPMEVMNAAREAGRNPFKALREWLDQREGQASTPPVEDDEPADRRAAVVSVAEVCGNPFCALGEGACHCGGVPADKPNPFAALAERLVTA